MVKQFFRVGLVLSIVFWSSIITIWIFLIGEVIPISTLQFLVISIVLMYFMVFLNNYRENKIIYEKEGFLYNYHILITDKISQDNDEIKEIVNEGDPVTNIGYMLINQLSEEKYKMEIKNIPYNGFHKELRYATPDDKLQYEISEFFLPVFITKSRKIIPLMPFEYYGKIAKKQEMNAIDGWRIATRDLRKKYKIEASPFDYWIEGGYIGEQYLNPNDSPYDFVWIKFVVKANTKERYSL